MKVLRVIVIIVLVIVALFVILGLAGPKTFDISRSATIDAPKELVFPYLKSLKHANAWAPWFEEDPEAEVSFAGTDGEVGSSTTWDGDKIGKGEQVITKIEPHSAVLSDLVFYPPWGESRSEGYLLVEDKGDQSEVTWGFKGDNGFVARVFSVLIGMEKNTAPMFERGLEKLNEMVTSDMNKEWKGQKVQYVQLDPMAYMTIKSEVPMDGIPNFLASSYGKIIGGVQSGGAEMTGQPSAIYYNWDIENGVTVMAAAIPVDKAVSAKGVEAVNFPGGKALIVDYYGSYENLGDAHEAVDAYAAHFELEMQSMVVEEYVTDPETETDVSNVLTKIYYRLN